MKLRTYVVMISIGVFLMASLLYFGLVHVPPQVLQYVVIIAVVSALGALAYTFLKNRPRRRKTLIGLRDDIHKFYGPEGMQLGEDGDMFDDSSHFLSKFEGLDGKNYGLGIMFNKDDPDYAKVYVEKMDTGEDMISWDDVDAADLNDIPRFIVSKIFPILFPKQIRLRAVTAFPKKKKGGKEEGPTVVETTLSREEAKEGREE